MKMNISYEVVDMRKVDRILGPVAILQNTPGGVLVKDINARGIFLDLMDDEDDNLIEVVSDVVTMHFPEGRVVLTPLRLESYRTRVLPFLPDGEPVYLDDEEVNADLYKRVAEADQQ